MCSHEMLASSVDCLRAVPPASCPQPDCEAPRCPAARGIPVSCLCEKVPEPGLGLGLSISWLMAATPVWQRSPLEASLGQEASLGSSGSIALQACSFPRGKEHGNQIEALLWRKRGQVLALLGSLQYPGGSDCQLLQEMCLQNNTQDSLSQTLLPILGGSPGGDASEPFSQGQLTRVRSRPSQGPEPPHPGKRHMMSRRSGSSSLCSWLGRQ